MACDILIGDEQDTQSCKWTSLSKHYCEWEQTQSQNSAQVTGDKLCHRLSSMVRKNKIEIVNIEKTQSGFALQRGGKQSSQAALQKVNQKKKANEVI